MANMVGGCGPVHYSKPWTHSESQQLRAYNGSGLVHKAQYSVQMGKAGITCLIDCLS